MSPLYDIILEKLLLSVVVSHLTFMAFLCVICKYVNHLVHLHECIHSLILMSHAHIIIMYNDCIKIKKCFLIVYKLY